MCLYRVGRNKIAQEDIVVFKVLTLKGKSPFQKFQYEPNMRYVSFFGRAERAYRSDPPNEIHEGLHAFVSRSMRFRWMMESRSRVAHRMIIPKGAKYALGEQGDIVSNIMITGDMKSPKTWADYNNNRLEWT